MIKNFIIKYRITLILSLFIACTLLIKFSFLDFVSRDMRVFLMNWCYFISLHEGLEAYQYEFANYPPLYTYILGLIVKSRSIDWGWGIKLVSSLFDYLLAFYVYKIIALKYGKTLWTILAGCTICILPTVLTNGALWGQCDVIYVSFVIMSIYYVLKDKITLAFILYGLALSLKIQALFIIPLFFILFLNNKKVKIGHFLLLPLVYFMTLIPCLIAGRGLASLLTIYEKQAKSFNGMLCHNGANIYTLTPNSIEVFGRSGVIFTAAFALLIVLIYSYKNKWNEEQIIESAFLSVLLVPFFLPFMHERYFYMADIFAVIYIFYFKRNYYFLLIPLISFFTYYPHLFSMHIVDLRILGFGMLIMSYLACKNTLLKNVKDLMSSNE